MKTNLLRTITTLVFLLLCVCAINPVNASSTGYGDTPLVTALDNPEATRSEVAGPDAEKRFLSAAKQHRIATRKIIDFSGVADGYYVVAGVFGDKNNATRFTTALERRKIAAKVLSHRGNKLNYVALSHDTDWKNAIALAVSKFNGTYTEKTWILQVGNAKSEIDIAPVEKRDIAKTAMTDFKKVSKSYGIASRTVQAAAGLQSGYYLVAGVYSELANTRKALSKFKSLGLEPGFVTHPETGLNYVYLVRGDHFEESINAAQSSLDGRYRGKVWILNVEREQNAAALNSVALVSEESAPAPAVGGTALSKGKAPYNALVLKDPVKSKLLEKADMYFDKLWYAEAADLYEKVLEKDGKNFRFEIIQKAGDAHYFNTNMERAHHWYDILYNNFRDQMSAENLFKYAHALKGTGKYSRAKRLMKLYNKAMEKESSAPVDRAQANANEIVLDNILNAEEIFGVKNMGINSEYSDFGPMYYNSNQLVFASAMDSSFLTTRRYKWNNQPYLDLYVAKINEESDEVKNAIKFSKQINTKYHEASVTFSPDNKVMYFTRNNYGKKLKRDKFGVNHLKIYMSKKVGDEWTEAVELPFNSDEYSTGHPALSPDGKQLYFVSDMPGSIGKTDIFVVDVLGEGSFSEPRNLGPEINTESREMFPFINDKKLYFSSDGHVGLGGLDIYEVAFAEEDGFLEVRNLGKPINSKVDDFSYIIDEASQTGFFASNRKGGKGDDDIYSFRRLILEEINENAIAGVVTDIVTGEVMPEALITLLDENNIKLKEVVAAEDGSFMFEDLDSNTKYTIKATKADYMDFENVVNTLDNELIATGVAMKRLEEIVNIEDGIRKLKIDMIYFDFDKSNIRPDAAEELDKLVGIMREYPSMVIKIESHTDSRGSRTYNRYLSNRRAKSTREYLIARGISPARIESATGYGEDRLLNECDGTVKCSRAQHQLNRRSEFIVVNM